MVLIEQLNENDEIVAIREDSDLKKEMFIHKGSLVFLKDKDNKIILTQCAKGKSMAGKWMSSVGGKVHHKETYLQAAYREMFEETQIKTKLKEEVKILYNESDYKCFFTLYTSNAININSIIPEEREIQAVKSFSVEEIKNKIKSNPKSFANTFIAVFNKYVEKLESEQ
jgi:isopentenyldiphosphate isomerase